MVPQTRLSVDLVKLACMLRIADAIHLDRRRAPVFAMTLEKPLGISERHWSFQRKLAFPQLADDTIIFTSGEGFEVDEAEAWWQCFDTLVAAEEELLGVDALFVDHARPRLRARAIKGTRHSAEMARYIPVSGWKPVDTSIHISNIPDLVQLLGGSKLYGERPTVVIRELIQNAIDAVEARRRLQNRDDDWGLISIGLNEQDGYVFLSVTDNGIGMSERVVTGALLDFGRSFWRSELASEEFPGLLAKKVPHIGQFGVGFYSTFMLGDEVGVITRRYDRAESETAFLEFRHGLKSRPLMRPAPKERIPADGGTRVEIKLAKDPRTKNGLEFSISGATRKHGKDIFDDELSQFPSLAELVGWIAPASSVTIEVNEFGSQKVAVKARDWLAIPPSNFFRRLQPVKKWHQPEVISFEKHLRVFGGAETERGRAALWPNEHNWGAIGVVTTGGLRLRSIPHLQGILPGEASTIGRNAGNLSVGEGVLAAWATEQAKLISRTKWSQLLKAQSAEIVLRCGGKIGALPIGRIAGKWLNAKSLKQQLRGLQRLPILVGNISYDDNDYVPKAAFDSAFVESSEVLFIPEVGLSEGSHLLSAVIAEIRTVWRRYEEDTDFDCVVGKVSGEEITRPVEIYQRVSD